MILLTVDLSVSIYFRFLLLQSQGTANFLLFFFLALAQMFKNGILPLDEKL